MRILMGNNYIITKYSYDRAKELGLTIKLSQFTTKKLDVYDAQNNYINSIGDSKYNDYPTYCILYNKVYADRRRELYHNRHKFNADVKYSKQWLALNLLW